MAQRQALPAGPHCVADDAAGFVSISCFLCLPLGARLIDHLFPDALRFQDKFNRFANGTVTRERFGCEMRCLFHFRDGIAHGYG
jgi:hypothetical protein